MFLLKEKTHSQIHCKKKKRKHFKENQLQQIFLFSQLIFVGNYFCCINLKQQVEKTQKSAEAGFPEQNILYSVVLQLLIRQIINDKIWFYYMQ